MILATWNLERLKHQSALNDINRVLDNLDASILVLTETDNRISLPNYETCITTSSLTEQVGINYQETERRVALYTNYEVVRHYETYDKYTSLCVELKTEYGNLIIYGTIIGVFGNRNVSFKEDLIKQRANIERYAPKAPLCFIGDYNTSFADNYYFTNWGRTLLNTLFEKHDIELVTRGVPEAIDHIALSRSLIINKSVEISEWNADKKYSDHKGIAVQLIGGVK